MQINNLYYRYKMKHTMFSFFDVSQCFESAFAGVGCLAVALSFATGALPLPLPFPLAFGAPAFFNEFLN
ncbi:MAG: hypothetical protein CMF17_09925 [Idiomarinaceae bacterium]|nr:hypothetical protein [Idiomarinaceae bacterium]